MEKAKVMIACKALITPYSEITEMGTPHEWTTSPVWEDPHEWMVKRKYIEAMIYMRVDMSPTVSLRGRDPQIGVLCYITLMP